MIFYDSYRNANCRIIDIDDVGKLDKILYSKYKDKCIIQDNMYEDDCTPYNIHDLKFKIIYLNVTVFDISIFEQIKVNISNSEYSPYLIGETYDVFPPITLDLIFSCRYSEITDMVKIGSLYRRPEDSIIEIIGHTIRYMVIILLLMTILTVGIFILHFIIIVFNVILDIMRYEMYNRVVF